VVGGDLLAGEVHEVVHVDVHQLRDDVYLVEGGRQGGDYLGTGGREGRREGNIVMKVCLKLCVASAKDVLLVEHSPLP
jgi:hypothetical protein